MLEDAFPVYQFRKLQLQERNFYGNPGHEITASEPVAIMTHLP